MGTMVQTYKLQEEDYRGERFKNHKVNLKNNNDVLNLTQPHIIKEIHKGYLDAGADLIETNTFNGTPISLLDFEMSDLAYEVNKRAAEIAREVTDTVEYNLLSIKTKKGMFVELLDLPTRLQVFRRKLMIPHLEMLPLMN